jgi:flagellar motility protein MotE (MotC chaperone)
MMREIVIFSILSFVLILVGVLYFLGFVSVGPPRAPVEVDDHESLARIELAAIEAQRRTLERRQEEIQGLMNDIELERKLISQEREQLNLHLDKIEELTLQLDDEHRQRINKLAKLYESMKPDQAAKIASSLDINLLIDIVSAMKDKQAAKMMAALPKSIAADISRRLGKTETK